MREQGETDKGARSFNYKIKKVLGSNVGFPGSSAGKESLVQLLGQEDPLEKGEATHSSILGLPWWLRR